MERRVDKSSAKSTEESVKPLDRFCQLMRERQMGSKVNKYNVLYNWNDKRNNLESAQYKQTIVTQQQNINQLLAFKDECSKLKSVVLELNKAMTDREESHKEVVEQMRRDFDDKSESFRCESVVRDGIESVIRLKINELSEALNEKEKECDKYESKIMSLNESLDKYREICEQKEKDYSRSRSLYESKIKSLNESIDKYREIGDQNEKNVKLNCLRQIETIRHEYEAQVLAMKQRCDQLGETNAALQMELESRKLLDNTNVVKSASNLLSNMLKAAPNNRPTESSDKIATQILNDNNEVTAGRDNDSTLKEPKRKKMLANSSLYLHYLRGET